MKLPPRWSFRGRLASHRQIITTSRVHFEAKKMSVCNDAISRLLLQLELLKRSKDPPRRSRGPRFGVKGVDVVSGLHHEVNT